MALEKHRIHIFVDANDPDPDNELDRPSHLMGVAATLPGRPAGETDSDSDAHRVIGYPMGDTTVNYLVERLREEDDDYTYCASRYDDGWEIEVWTFCWVDDAGRIVKIQNLRGRHGARGSCG